MNNFKLPPIPEGETWTIDQWKAIQVKNKDILVAAAAGSGKTAVLVNRIIQKILSALDPVNVDELLVVTFTSASAAEMRHRIGEALEKAIEQNPESRHLRKQLGLLNKSSISTLHSFCMEVIRKYYYLIDVDPGFRIADQTEAQLIKDEVMDELFEEEYGKKDNEAFFNLVDSFTNDRSDTALQDIVRSIYEFAMSNPSPEQYLTSMASMYDVSSVGKLEDLPFIQALLFDIELQLESAIELIKKGTDIAKLPGGPAPRAETFKDDEQVISTLIQANRQSWTTLYEAMQTYQFSKAGQVKGDQYDPELKEKADKLRNKAKEKIKGIKDELFSRRPESFLRDMEEMKPLIDTLVQIVKTFLVRFEKAKREKGLVDYSDLEHYCLDILSLGVTDDGRYLPSEAALAYKSHFKEVYVDEYQDTNMVQETILKLVANEDEVNGNLFMVGDVKQSIYRFRLAEPNLFLGKYNRFLLDGHMSGLRIDLAQNFRSRKEVLDATNYLFKQIMGVKVGEIEYDEAAELKNGAPYPLEEPYPVEVMLINQNHSGQSEDAVETETDAETAIDEFDVVDLEKSQLEAKVMANKIKEMIGEKRQVYNTKTKSYRPVQYRDIVILLRSMTWAPQIMEEFKQQGIPIYANLSTGYFEATEIAIMISLLRVIDNPYQDIPLASVLRSPIVGLNEEELSLIRIQQKKGSFWDAVSSFIRVKPNEKTEGFYEKIRIFYDTLKEWRTMARQGSLADLIWQLYRETSYYDFVGGLPGGKQRQANLRALYDRARQYEQTSFRGLFRFLRFIERMIERGDDLGAARALGEQEDVVRIMTIHSSKGLEFPVVFIAGMSRNFNMQDIRKAYMLDKEYGFAAKYINVDKRISYPSLPQLAFKRKKKMEMLAEEMRVLYVALTRAKEKLYLIGSLKDADKIIDQWNDTASNSNWLLKDYERASAGSYLDWIGPALIRHQDCSELRRNESSLQIPVEIHCHPSDWKITIINAEDIKAEALISTNDENDHLLKVKSSEPIGANTPFKEEIKDRLMWEYTYPDAATHRSKQSVSELKRGRELMDEQSGTDIVRGFKKEILKRPKFMQEKSLSPAERGTAMHMVMQHVDFSKEITADTIKQQVEWMVGKELLTPEQALVIDANLIAQFFSSDLGKRYFHAHKLNREIPFTLSLPAKDVYPLWRDEEELIFVQGVIDCVFEDEQGLVLIDYKTDGITDRFKGGFAQAKPILEERYKMQIELYTKAIETIWKRKVDERYLFFFDGSHILKL
jgi:ATP-dependent helicase/nuclease subunit A